MVDVACLLQKDNAKLCEVAKPNFIGERQKRPYRASPWQLPDTDSVVKVPIIVEWSHPRVLSDYKFIL